MYIFEFVVPELTDVRLIVDEISQVELVIGYTFLDFIGRDFKNE